MKTQQILEHILEWLESSTPTLPPPLTVQTSPISTNPIEECKYQSPLKPATPSKFNGDQSKGQTFLNSCQLYMQLCPDSFVDEQAKIYWAISYFKTGCTASFTNRILQHGVEQGSPYFGAWWQFEEAFIKDFCPQNEVLDALT